MSSKRSNSSSMSISKLLFNRLSNVYSMCILCVHKSMSVEWVVASNVSGGMSSFWNCRTSLSGAIVSMFAIVARMDLNHMLGEMVWHNHGIIKSEAPCCRKNSSICLYTWHTRDNLLVSSRGVRDELLSVIAAFLLAAVDARSHVPIGFTCGCASIFGVISDVVWNSDCVSSFSGSLIGCIIAAFSWRGSSSFWSSKHSSYVGRRFSAGVTLYVMKSSMQSSRILVCECRLMRSFFRLSISLSSMLSLS